MRRGGLLSEDDLISCSVTHRDGTAVLVISGEVDLASAPVFERAIADVLAGDPPSLIIDLVGVQFLASAGVGLLMQARSRFSEADRFSVVTQDPPTIRVIQVLGMDGLLSLRSTVEDALSAVKPR
jgi:anti-sigma B factor antagonist